MAEWLAEAGLDVLVLEDTEGRRCSSVRYLTGLPQDGILFIFRNGRTVLSPWDVILAKRTAWASDITALSEFDRTTEKVLAGILAREGFSQGSRLELSLATPYSVFMKLQKACPDVIFSCPEKGIEAKIKERRALKDPEELSFLRKAAEITNEVLVLLEEKFKTGDPVTELDLAMFIEAEGRQRGAEGTGFETLAAGPERSFGIHAFPAYTRGPHATEGLSILDFGFLYQGYTSDVTMTVARGKLSPKQEKMINLVQKAYDNAVKQAVPGALIRDICRKVDNTFAVEGFFMPHSLGHGIGLDAHEAPMVSTRADEKAVLQPGMVITIEPGLYAADTGGVRLENDLLITENGSELLTRSRILRLS